MKSFTRRNIFNAGVAASLAGVGIAKAETGPEEYKLSDRMLQRRQHLMDTMLMQEEEVKERTRSALSLQALPFYNLTTTGQRLELGPYMYDVYQTIELGTGDANNISTAASVSITGRGCGANEGELGFLEGGTYLRWRGPAGQPMIRVRGPIYGVQISGLTLDCAGIASVGIQMDHPINATLDQVHIRNFTNIGLRLRSTMGGRPGMAVNACGNRFTQMRTFSMNHNAVGYDIGDEPFFAGTSSNTFEQCSALAGGYGWWLRGVDYLRLNMCQSYYGAKACMAIAPDQKAPWYPSAIYVYEWSGDNLPVVIGNWTCVPNPGVIFTNYHREWNGGPAHLNSSFGPAFPTFHPGFQGTDVIGTSYNISKKV